MTIGIYIINLGDENQCYIGQSTHIESRLQRHKGMLERGVHYNKKLQSAYIGTFNGSVLEACSIEDLTRFEDSYIIEFNSIDSGYNITCGGSNGGRGVHASKSIYTREQLIDIFISLADPELSNKDISSIHDVPVTLVGSIVYNKRHAWLAEEFPEIHTLIQDNVSSKIRFKSSNNISKRKGIVNILVSPSGINFTFDNVTAFAKEHDLNPSHTCQVLRGLAKQHKGWKLPIKESEASE